MWVSFQAWQSVICTGILFSDQLLFCPRRGIHLLWDMCSIGCPLGCHYQSHCCNPVQRREWWETQLMVEDQHTPKTMKWDQNILSLLKLCYWRLSYAVMNGYMSNRIVLMYLLRTTWCVQQEKLSLKAINKSSIDQACSVKMTGYWSRSFFASLIGPRPCLSP